MPAGLWKVPAVVLLACAAFLAVPQGQGAGRAGTAPPGAARDDLALGTPERSELRLGAADAGRMRPAGTIELARDGRSDFSLCVSAEESPVTRAAADTLRRYLHAVCGALLPVTEAYDPAARQVVFEVGSSRDPELNVAGLGHDGFRIKTVEESVYLSANSDYGIQNAVYTFLETYLGCRKYSPEVTVVPRRPSIVLLPIDDTQVPPITFRMQGFHEPAYDAWHKLNTNEEFGLFVHTFRKLVPPERYFAEHPEYFSLLKGRRTPDGQLCLTHPDVYRIVVEDLRARMREKPRATFWSVSQNDTYVPCECPACRALDDAEGSPSGSLLAFVNRVADAFPDRRISTLAYQYSRSAPRHLRPRPNVNIMLCSIECNRSRPIVDDPQSADFVRDVENWGRITDDILLWDYVIQFRNLVSPFPNLRVLQPNLQFFVQNGITSVFEQGLGELHGEFAELRGYLIAKLLWNPNADVDSLLTDFLTGFYGDAAPFLRRYIDTMHDALEASGEPLDIYGYPWPSPNGYLASARMEEYRRCFDSAEAAVAADAELLARVQTARLPIQFAELEQAKVIGMGEGGAFETGAGGPPVVRPEIERLLSTFAERCRRAGIPRLWEHGTSPDAYEAATRRFFAESVALHLARGCRVVLGRPASPKYRGGDESALTDGLKGWDDYHTHWLGFEGEDLEATIDLGSVRSVSRVDTDFLQDINSWVFMPLTVSCLISTDGRDFHPIGELQNSVPAEKWGPIIAPFDFRCEPTEVRFVRVKAASMKTCPAWHKGSGGPSWIFIDEITVW